MGGEVPDSKVIAFAAIVDCEVGGAIFACLVGAIVDH